MDKRVPLPFFVYAVLGYRGAQINTIMKTKLFVLFAALLFVFTGCSTIGFTSLTDRQVSQTTVNLSSNNYRIIGDCSGEVSYTYIFGFGGPSKSVAFSNAMDAMYNNAQLSGSQAVINIRGYQEVKTVLGVYIKRTIRVSGQIIEFR